MPTHAMPTPASPPPASFDLAFEPGQYVRHPGQPQWGVGQVQSSVGTRVTVNFAHAGKIMVNAAVVTLIGVDAAECDRSP
jgi:hypothetical protein